MAFFYFSRFHITTDGGVLDKAEFLLAGIRSDAEIIFRKDNFRFVSAEIEKVGSNIYLTGVLAKYKPEDLQEFVNEQNQIDTVALRNKVLASVRFIIDPENSIIIFEESKSHIPKASFSKRFIELFQVNYSEQFVDFVISPITEKYTFTDRIRTLTTIKKVIINLVPSNPNNSDLWEDVDNRLRNNHITNYKEVQENKREGESLIIDEETESKFHMSEDGYGVTTAIGQDETGKQVVISTNNANIWEKADIPNDIEAIRSIIEACQEKLREITSRTNEA